MPLIVPVAPRDGGGGGTETEVVPPDGRWSLLTPGFPVTVIQGRPCQQIERTGRAEVVHHP